MRTPFVMLAALLLGAAPAFAQTYPQQRTYTPRQSEIRRQNYNRQEATRLLFGPRGLPALTRPSDPWNVNRALYYSNRPNGIAAPARGYYYR